jgi:hypothetical protein
VFNTVGNVVTWNVLNGNTWTLGSGIIVHGKSGTVGGGLTNNGLILADTAGETIRIADVINNGNVIAAPGTFTVNKFTQNGAGALTVGVGGTTAGTSYGVFKFVDTTYVPALNGTFNAVTLNGYAPAAGATFNVVSFTKAPTGAFVTKNLDAGNGKGFDLTQTTTAISIKAKSIASPFATRASTRRVDGHRHERQRHDRRQVGAGRAVLDSQRRDERVLRPADHVRDRQRRRRRRHRDRQRPRRVAQRWQRQRQPLRQWWQRLTQRR